MGFKYWFAGLIMISMFLMIIGGACLVLVIWGSQLINDLGNFPSKSAKILASAWWIYLVEFFFLTLLIGYGIFLNNCKVD